MKTGLIEKDSCRVFSSLTVHCDDHKSDSGIDRIIENRSRIGEHVRIHIENVAVDDHKILEHRYLSPIESNFDGSVENTERLIGGLRGSAKGACRRDTRDGSAEIRNGVTTSLTSAGFGNLTRTTEQVANVLTGKLSRKVLKIGSRRGGTGHVEIPSLDSEVARSAAKTRESGSSRVWDDRTEDSGETDSEERDGSTHDDCDRAESDLLLPCALLGFVFERGARTENPSRCPASNAVDEEGPGIPP